MKENIAFLGGLFPGHLEEEIVKSSRGDFQYAASNLQWAIIKGLDEINQKPVHICTVMLVNSYPINYNKPIIRTEEFSHCKGASDISYGFINLKGIRLISRFFSARKGIYRWCRRTDDQKIILCYSAHTPHLLAASLARRKFRNTKLCLIVTDLPELMSSKRNLVYRFLKSIDRKLIEQSMKVVDSFVVLAPAMAERLKTGKRPVVCVEGVFDPDVIKDFQVKKENNKVIMYAGILEKRHGLMILIDAFKMIKGSEYELWICGEGEERDEILRYMRGDSRIRYMGLVPRSKILELQQKATVLVNPRPSKDEFTRYSFPSKTLEYMVSATPVIMNRFSSVPDEYYSYCFVPEKENAQSLKDTILKVTGYSREYRDEFGFRARDFIISNKNPRIQASKIYQMIMENL